MTAEIKDRFALIGASKTGIALAYYLEKAGYTPAFLWNRSPKGINMARGYVNFQKVSTEIESLPHSIEWIIIAVSDDAIQTVAQNLSQVLKDGNGKKVFHISGAWDSGLLNDLKMRHCRTGSFHPLLSVTDIETGIRMMGNAVFSCEGEIAGELQQLAENIGGTGIQLNADQKSLIHLCAVFANNFQTVTMQALKQLALSKNISSEMLSAFLKTLSQQAIDNAWSKSLGESLTGPVARGDQKTIDKHLNQLKDTPELKNLYEQYVALTRQLLKKELEQT
ncbi:MAG: DUF2520 domain-containing protein [Candidatus Marinimicrobia bacterium]|nr:DUF2520 domain-containing protein [Candidatus Neomarinimicrobiota bacterium]